MSGIQNGLLASYSQGGNDTFTKFLLHCNGTNASTTFTDSSTSAHVVNAGGDVQLSTASPKFGTAALTFDGSGDFIYLDTQTDFTFGASDFTIDLWINPTNFAGANKVIYDGRPTGTDGVYPTIYLATTTGNLMYYVSAADRITGTAVTAGVWSHIALTRNSTSTRLFINGTQSGSTLTDGNTYLVADANRPMFGIASTDATSGPFLGGMDEIRVSKGIARWTTTFVPPLSAYF